jgi:hypothetical protein
VTSGGFARKPARRRVDPIPAIDERPIPPEHRPYRLLFCRPPIRHAERQGFPRTVSRSSVHGRIRRSPRSKRFCLARENFGSTSFFDFKKASVPAGESRFCKCAETGDRCPLASGQTLRRSARRRVALGRCNRLLRANFEGPNNPSKAPLPVVQPADANRYVPSSAEMNLDIHKKFA